MTDARERMRRLAWTTTGLGAALGPHFLHLKPWIAGLVIAIGAWRLLAERRGWRLPGAFVRGLVAVALLAVVFASYTTITGLDGGTALLALMSALKLLETRAPRDHVVLIFIGWFLCLAAFLYTQDLPTVAWVIATVWLLAAALLPVSRQGHDGPAPRPFRVTGALLAKAVPAALVLFLFFPRVSGSYWGAPSNERALSGLSEKMSPGDISELTQNDTVAFRVRFAVRPPSRVQRYFRGPVLTVFDGETWSRGAGQFYLRSPVQYDGAPVDYTVTLEPTGQSFLFALEMAESWTPGLATLSWDYHLRSRQPVHAVLQYEGRSYPRYRAGLHLSAALRNHNLQLPPRRNPRTLALARQMRAASASDRAFARSVLDMFRDQEFFYTLTPDALGRDPVDEFLFDTHRGFCGHYASAFTTMMRAAGVPARVVAGYQGGDWNPIGGYLILRQAYAHAWSEIWLPDSGWTRIDPTAAVAPERIERGVADALAGDEFLQGTLLGDMPWSWQARMFWDNVNARWNDWVVRFSRDRQESLLRGFGFENPDWRHLSIVLGAGLVAALALLTFWLAWEFRPRRPDAAAACYRRFTERLARRGIERLPHEAPADFALRVERLRPDLAREAAAITALYQSLRYLPGAPPESQRTLRLLVARFNP